jgi:hypothetical protein
MHQAHFGGSVAHAFDEADQVVLVGVG